MLQTAEDERKKRKQLYCFSTVLIKNNTPCRFLSRQFTYPAPPIVYIDNFYELFKNKIMKNKIKFTCKKCGACCSVGFIYLKKGEVEKIAAHINMPVKQFKKKYTEWFLFLGRALKWNDRGACIFLKNKECSIYSARPSQCSTWPYWQRLINNQRDLKRAKGYCDGIIT